MSSLIPTTFTPGSLYIAGFTQASAPHVGLILPTNSQAGALVHIKVDRSKSPHWMHQYRVQKIEGDMFLSSLLKIHDISEGEMTVKNLQKAASAVPVPENDIFGECSNWVFKVIQHLDRLGLVALKDIALLENEFSTFASESQGYARRDRFPNVAISKYCA
ncbi:hypothetical protein AN958_06236 [Leucoagaricus sp. SymC.cos]|nr:hypothetical protein AN958_06236 [Leucoagaricus sp. SymC.cos]